MDRMVMLRSRRIEGIFGGPLEDLTERGVQSLVDNQVSEEYDLDFKASLYGNNDAAKRSLATDVAALANTAGGVIVLGVEEDAQARASGSRGVPVSDAEAARMRLIVASLVAPLPKFDVLPVPRLGDPEHGFYVLAVPRSPSGPHAVLINDGFRYPRRNGSTTRYLSEPEVATAYQERTAGRVGQRHRAAEIEESTLEQLQRQDRPWIVVSAVPELLGRAHIDQEQLHRFRDAMIGQGAWAIAPMAVQFNRFRVDYRRFVADGGQDNARATWVMTEQHVDGAGTYALQLPDLNDQRRVGIANPQDVNAMVADENVVLALLTALLRLAAHARDRAAAGGDLLCRAHLLPPRGRPAMELGHARNGFGATLSEVARDDVTSATTTVSLDDVVEFGPPLLSATAHLANELAQSFGVPELGQVTIDGRVRRRYWRAPGDIELWAGASGVEVSNDYVGD